MLMNETRQFKSLGLCDGISCIQPALVSAGITNYVHISAEIDKKAKLVTKMNFPDTIMLDDVKKIKGSDLGHIDLVGVGSPCKNLSMAGNKSGLATTCGIPIFTYEHYEHLKNKGYEFTDSCVFWECIRIVRELRVINPNLIFIFENVTNKKWEDVMTFAIGVNPITINSADFIPQNRLRNYWTNIPVIPHTPQGITLGDLIPGAVSGYGWRGRQFKETGEKWIQHPTINPDYVANCITTWKSTEKIKGCQFYIDTKGKVHPLTIEQLEQLQGLPIGYTNAPGITDTDRLRMIGNGWTVPVIAHLLSSLKQMVNNKSMELV